MASLSLHVLKCCLAAFAQEVPRLGRSAGLHASHPLQPSHTLRRAGEAGCGAFDLHSSAAVDSAQRTSPPEAQGLQLFERSQGCV